MSVTDHCWSLRWLRALPAGLVVGFVLAGSAEAAFAYRKPLTIQGARVSGGPHADFPVLVSLIDPNLRTTANGGRVTSANGFDIAFMLPSTGAVLDHEIERYDGTTGTLVAWVRIPSVTAVNQNIFIYYGDPEITCAQNSPRNAWDTNFRYVYHFSETAGNPLDSTVNNVAATLNPQGDPAAVEIRNAAGQIAGSLQFTTPPAPPPATFLQTTDSHLTLADGVLPANQPFTIEGWFNATTWGAAGDFIGLITKGRDSAPGFVDWVGIDKVPVGGNARLSLIMQLPEGNVNGGTNLAASTWIYGAVTFDGASARRVYLNGVLDGSDLVTATTVNAVVENTRVGDDSNGNYLNGRVDEVRFSNVLRSAGWIQTTFNNDSCPATSTCGVAANRFVVEGAEQVVPTNYRSIGDTTTPYSTGSVTATAGSPIVFGTGTAWRTANRGRGDTITFGGFTGTILSVDSESQLTLVSPSTVTGAFPVYAINRKFADLASWEDCIDGGSSPCGPDPVIASGNFITGDRREVGIVYKDKVYVDTVADALFDVLVIDGSTTGPFHTITLTADPGNRHNGIPGSGVVVDLGAAADGNGIFIGDNFATVEWMEVRNAVSLADGIQVATVNGSNRRVVRNCIVHDAGSRGIQVHTNAVDSYDVEIYNNFVYRVSRGIFIEDPLLPTSTIRILNNTVFSCTSGTGAGISGVAPVSGTPVTVSNNISHSNTSGSFGVLGLNPASSNNLASDLTGTTHSPAGGGLNSVPLTGAGGVNFINTTVGSENLHLRTTAPLSAAQDAGVNLSCFLQRDIDGVIRLNPWEIGADDVSQTTVVTLQSFTASGAESAVNLVWSTASELQNLGFHLYRSLSAEGPYERITSSLIPGLGSSPTGANYSYRDNGLIDAQTYFYKLEDIETTGTTTLHGPVWATAGVTVGGGDCGCSSGDSGQGSGSARITYGQPEEASFRIMERGSSYVLLELLTPGFYAVPEGDGTVHLEVPGFFSGSVPGAPDVPVKRALVEALAGRGVRLASVVASDEVRFDALRVAAAEAPAMVVTDQGMVKAGLTRKTRASRPGLFPRTRARVLEVIFQGETKKVHLELAPLRYNPRTGRTVLTRRLLVRLDFTGVEKGERTLGGSRGRRLPRIPLVRSRGLVAELVTPEAGLQAVRYEEVLSGPRGFLSSSLRLSRRGQSVAFHVEPERAVFAPGSVLYFVSEGSKSNPWGDAVYELEVGKAGTRMPALSGAPVGSLTTEYLDFKEWEENRYYQAGLLEAPDLWLWDLLVSPVTKSYPFTLSQISPSSTSAHLTLRLQGASDFEADPDHHVRLSLNGQVVAEATWDGKVERVIEAEVGPGILQEGANTLSLENVGDTAAAYSMVFLNRFSLTYPRLLVAEQGLLQGGWNESGTAVVSGLGGVGFVLDVQDTPAQWLRGVQATSTDLSFRAEAARKYLVVSAASVKRPEVRRPLASRLRNPQTGAEWLLVAPREFLGAAQPLLELRRSQGLKVKAVSLEEIEQEFGYAEHGPSALKEFLEYAYQSWPKPLLHYVVLLGDGSYDPKDYLKTGVKDRIPPYIVKTSYLWTASDPAYGAVNGEDLVPDVAVGRLPAGSVEQAQLLVDKIVAFEASGRTLAGRAVLIADNADLGGSFEVDADELASSVLRHREVEKVYLRDLQGGTRATIVAAFDNGPALVSYMGHGGTAVWASENVFNNTDVPSLSAQGQQPLLLTLNCLNGFFHFPPLDSLAEAFLKAEGKGAVAAFSPSGLSVNDAAHLYHKAVLSEIESGRHARLGDAILAAQSTYADSGVLPELLSIYHLFGDPALRIR